MRKLEFYNFGQTGPLIKTEVDTEMSPVFYDMKLCLAYFVALRWEIGKKVLLLNYCTVLVFLTEEKERERARENQSELSLPISVGRKGGEKDTVNLI